MCRSELLATRAIENAGARGEIARVALGSPHLLIVEWGIGALARHPIEAQIAIFAEAAVANPVQRSRLLGAAREATLARLVSEPRTDPGSLIETARAQGADDLQIAEVLLQHLASVGARATRPTPNDVRLLRAASALVDALPDDAFDAQRLADVSASYEVLFDTALGETNEAFPPSVLRPGWPAEAVENLAHLIAAEWAEDFVERWWQSRAVTDGQRAELARRFAADAEPELRNFGLSLATRLVDFGVEGEAGIKAARLLRSAGLESERVEAYLLQEALYVNPASIRSASMLIASWPPRDISRAREIFGELHGHHEVDHTQLAPDLQALALAALTKADAMDASPSSSARNETDILRGFAAALGRRLVDYSAFGPEIGSGRFDPRKLVFPGCALLMRVGTGNERLLRRILALHPWSRPDLAATYDAFGLPQRGRAVWKDVLATTHPDEAYGRAARALLAPSGEGDATADHAAIRHALSDRPSPALFAAVFESGTPELIDKALRRAQAHIAEAAVDAAPAWQASRASALSKVVLEHRLDLRQALGGSSEGAVRAMVRQACNVGTPAARLEQVRRLLVLETPPSPETRAFVLELTREHPGLAARVLGPLARTDLVFEALAGNTALEDRRAAATVRVEHAPEDPRVRGLLEPLLQPRMKHSPSEVLALSIVALRYRGTGAQPLALLAEKRLMSIAGNAKLSTSEKMCVDLLLAGRELERRRPLQLDRVREGLKDGVPSDLPLDLPGFKEVLSHLIATGARSLLPRAREDLLFAALRSPAPAVAEAAASLIRIPGLSSELALDKIRTTSVWSRERVPGPELLERFSRLLERLEFRARRHRAISTLRRSSPSATRTRSRPARRSSSNVAPTSCASCSPWWTIPIARRHPCTSSTAAPVREPSKR